MQNCVTPITIFTSHSDSVVAALEGLYVFMVFGYGLDLFSVVKLKIPRTLRKYPNVLVEFFAPWYHSASSSRSSTFHCNGLSHQCKENCRCPACVNFNPQLERLQAATKNIPLKVVKVSDTNIMIKWSSK